MVNQKKSPLELRVRKCSIYYHAFPALPRCRRYVQWTRTPEGAGPQLDTINQSGATTHGWRLCSQRSVALPLIWSVSNHTSLHSAVLMAVIDGGQSLLLERGIKRANWSAVGQRGTVLLLCCDAFLRGGIEEMTDDISRLGEGVPSNQSGRDIRYGNRTVWNWRRFRVLGESCQWSDGMNYYKGWGISSNCSRFVRHPTVGNFHGIWIFNQIRPKEQFYFLVKSRSCSSLDRK